MASPAQASLSCEFCEENPDIRWYCYECSLHLCEKCKVKLHSRVKSAQKHKIVEIQNKIDIDDDDDFVSEFISENNTLTDSEYKTSTEHQEVNVHKHIPCRVHHGNFYFVFCCECDDLFCATCLLKLHNKKFNNHNLLEIDEAYVNKKAEVVNAVDHVKNEILKDVKNEKEKVEEITGSKDHQINATKADIISRTEELTKFIKHYSDGLLKHLESDKDSNETIKTENIHVLNKFEIDVTKEIKQVERALQIDDLEKVFYHAKTFKQKTDFTKPTIVWSSKLFVAKKNVTEEVIRCVFGSLAEIRLTKTYKTDFPVVQKLVAMDSQLYISNDEMNALRRIKPEEDDIHTVSNMGDVQVVDMAAMRCGHLILKLFRSDRLELLLDTGERKDFWDTSPMIPLSVHVTKSDDILVAVKESTGDNYILTDQSRRQLIVLSRDVQEKHVFEYDNENRRLFTYICQITSTEQGGICVIDRLSEDFNGRIIMLEENGTLKWVYNGGSEAGIGNNAFIPRDIVATSAGNIIASDRSNHLLHVLFGNGGLLTLIDTSQLGILLPHALDIDSYGLLWVGCSVYQGEPYEAKLHTLRFSGF